MLQYRTEKEYRAIDAISNSSLSMLEYSPAHYQESIRSPKKPTEAQIQGSYFDAYLLEPEKLSEFAMKPDGMNLATKEGKEWKESNKDKTVVPESIVKNFQVMADIIKSFMPDTIEHGLKQYSKVMTDKLSGLQIKGKFDLLFNGTIFDLKTTESARPDEFAKSAWNYRYYRQGAFYLDLLREEGYNEFVLIAIEKEAPFGLTLHRITPDLIQYGRNEYRRYLDTIADCRANNNWPSYEKKLNYIDIPNWVKR